VSVQDQTITGPGKARLRAAVLWQTREFPIEIYMHDRGYGWKVYDLSAWGISAVQVYRAQFQEILRTRSPEEVIHLIRSRLQDE
jgi:ABC-type transporter MlaC component